MSLDRKYLYQASAELALPVDVREVAGACQDALGGANVSSSELALELRAFLSTAAPWAPQVRPNEKGGAEVG